ncbi:MAG: hypothetical protein ACI4ER_02935 [Suilimivivens sp.]
MTDVSKREKEKKKLAKKRNKKLQKRVKRFNKKVENTVSFFAVFLCVIMVIMEVIDTKKKQEIKGDKS